MISMGGSSYWDWANALSTLSGKIVSKQAVFKRMNKAWVDTVKALLQYVISVQLIKGIPSSVFCCFANVWLQDSTSLHLPDALIGKYKGNKARGKSQSVAKLNVIIHAFTGFCPVLEWSNFIVAEQSLSPDILKIAKAGDLVIRDMGYFVMDVFERMTEARIFFLSRLKYGLCIYDIKSEERLDLIKILKNKNFIDLQIICGREYGLKVRLVAIKLSPGQACERRRKARLNKQKGTNHSKEYYALLDYCLFITTVSEDIWSYRQVAEAYRVRWNIEIVFKSWKSGLKLDKLIPKAVTKTERVESFLYLMMIYIVLFQMIIWTPLRMKLHKSEIALSILKLTKWSIINAMDWLANGLTVDMEKEILYYCRYDTRSRYNAHDTSTAIFKPLS